MIPKHFSCLSTGDYWPYLTSFKNAPSPLSQGLRHVWGHRFPGSALYPTPTGRHALWYFLETLEFQGGDEVLIAAYNFYIIVRILLQKGLKPVFVDVDPETLCMDPADLTNKVSKKSRLVVVTHMFGNPANMVEIETICQQNDLWLFEDCAHAVGTLCNQEQVGQSGDGALFSFGIQKLVNSFGGGMLVLSENLAPKFELPPHSIPKLASFSDTFMRALTSILMTPSLYGITLHQLQKAINRFEDRLPKIKAIIDPAKDNPEYRFYNLERAPYKSFMTEMHRLQLARLNENINRRREIVMTIKHELQDIADISVLYEDKYGHSNYSYFGIYVPDPHALSHFLAQNGIDSCSQEYYDCASLEQFSSFYSKCENAHYASHHILRLPSYPCLRDSEVEKIFKTIKLWFTNHVC